MAIINLPIVNIKTKEIPLPKTYEEFKNGLNYIFLKFQDLIMDYPEFNYNIQNEYNQYLTRLLSADLIEKGVECLIRGGPGSNSDGQALMEASMHCDFLRARDMNPLFYTDNERQVILVDNGEGGISQFPYTNLYTYPRKLEVFFIYKDKKISDLMIIWKGLN